MLSWYYIFDYPEHSPERVGVFFVAMYQLLNNIMHFFFEKFCRNILQIWENVVPLQRVKDDTMNN